MTNPIAWVLQRIRRLKSRHDTEVEFLRPCTRCPNGQVIVIGWTGWEETLGCTRCDWMG